jgi:hypothetical protein
MPTRTAVYTDNTASVLIPSTGSLLLRQADGTYAYVLNQDTIPVVLGSGGGGGSGDIAASYLVVSNTASLSNERSLAAGPGIVFVDGGANGIFAISASLVAGPNITISIQNNGAIAISASSGGGGGGSTYPTRIYVGKYTATYITTSATPEVVGGGYVAPSEHPTTNCYLRSILSTNTGSNTAYVQLFNITSGALVHIGGAGITTLSTSNTTPTMLQSINLFGATNFSVGNAVYEVRIFGTGSVWTPLTLHHTSELVFS